MITVSIDLGERSYPIRIGRGLLDRIGSLTEEIVSSQVFVVSNPSVYDLYGEALESAFSSRHFSVFRMPDGEAHKSLATYGDVMDALMRERHNRTTCVIALGGGVVGDLAGFAAATFQRGVKLVQVPTTLLSQVDSSVGGKTAVNHPQGKNMIGAFYQPRTVVIDTDVLATLPDREYAAGLAEVVKYGVIVDAAFFDWLSEHVDELKARSSEALAYAIKRSCEIKAQVVSEDERESGRRAILNYGHTFGHALESLLGYGRLLHGEAVSVGMVMAARYSERLNLAPQGTAARIESLLTRFDLPAGVDAELDTHAMMEAMGMDKKAVDGGMRFIVCHELGSVSVRADDGSSALLSTLDEFLS